MNLGFFWGGVNLRNARVIGFASGNIAAKSNFQKKFLLRTSMPLPPLPSSAALLWASVLSGPCGRATPPVSAGPYSVNDVKHKKCGKKTFAIFFKSHLPEDHDVRPPLPGHLDGAGVFRVGSAAVPGADHPHHALEGRIFFQKKIISLNL